MMPIVKEIQISGMIYRDVPFDLQCLTNSTGNINVSGTVRVLWNFVAPGIFCVGLVGNSLILGVMTRSWMRGTSTSSYLIAMAIADLLVLLSGMLPEWLERNESVTFKELHPASCKAEKFIFYTAGDTAIWIRVLFTLDRFVAVCFPMSDSEYCLPWKAKYYSLGAFIAAVVKNFHVFITRGTEYNTVDEAVLEKCQYVLQNLNISLSPFGNLTANVLVSNCGATSVFNEYFESFVRPWIAFSLVSLLPFVIILLCNLLIVRSLIELKRTRAEHLLVRTNRDRHVVQMTAMCLSASFCFLVCVTPSIILLIGKPYWTHHLVKNPAYEIAKAINNQLYYIVHSINFFLYCITGKRFRDSLVAMFRPGQRYSSFASSIRSSAFSVGVVTRNSLPVSNRYSTALKMNDYIRVSPQDRPKDVEDKL